MTTRFVVVHDEPHACAYLPGQTARLPLELPSQRLGPDEVDEMLSRGDRRAGPTFYRTQCPSCRACEPLRVAARTFSPSRSQRRVWRQNASEVEARLGPAVATARHVELFNRHKRERGLAVDDLDLDLDAFRRYYVDSGIDTREVAYLVDGRLVAFSIVDLGRTSVSSVYHSFDPDESRRSLGVYSVLREIDLFGALGFRWYYLGLYVAGCSSLAYKARYFPHERRRDGAWRAFTSSLTDEEGKEP